MPKFVPRQRKHKGKTRDNQSSRVGEVRDDANLLEILPAAKAEKEEKRRRLREELRAQHSNISAKKQKRLDKYISTKLKKEENLELLKKLADSKVDTSLLQSSKKLGRVTETRREALSRAFRESNAGIDVERNKTLLVTNGRSSSQPSAESIDASAEQHLDSDDSASAIVAPPVQAPSGFGSGLKRPLETDEQGKPVLRERKRRKKYAVKAVEVGELEWEGFGSDPEGMFDGVESVPTNGDLKGQLELGNSLGRSASDEDSAREDSVVSSDQGTSTQDGDDTSGSESESNMSSESLADEDELRPKERSSAFKVWASQQRNATLSFIPSAEAHPSSNGTATSKPVNYMPRPLESEPLPPELEVKASDSQNRKAFAVQVTRSPEIQQVRLGLPVVAEEQKIMEAIHNNDAVVIWGATGSGKTTQVPQFLYEAGYGSPNGPTPGMIGVTQPRRVAAVSMSRRVQEELGDAKATVSYQIRYDSSVSDKTAIKFMTDGVLLREISQDFALLKYSAIIIDEAHERSVNTDVLIGMISRVVDLRKKLAQEDPKVKSLKFIIMSATLRISDFVQNKQLFRSGPPLLVQAEGRQYPVTVHFARRTRRDYLEEAFRKVSSGHKKLPPGAMLVFLTGQSEIMTLCRRLKQAFGSTSGHSESDVKVSISGREAPLETEDIDLGGHDDLPLDNDGSDSEPDIRVEERNEEDEFEIGEPRGDSLKIHVLPLYSQLPTNQQLRVFEPPPDGSRLIVVATNVAETSLTIPGIRYVFDCGRAKVRQYDRDTGVQMFEIGWISKASASQRTGRAGRTGPGHCYRLFSSAVYERDFAEHDEPEILRTPVEGIVLQLKSMNIDHVTNFPFPTPPDRQDLATAEKHLTYLGALSAHDKRITDIGKEISAYPLNPRFARMLHLGQVNGCAAFSIALVAALATPHVFIPEHQLNLSPLELSEDRPRTEEDNLEDSAREKRRQAYNKAHASLSRWDRTSDAMKMLTALCAYAHSTPSGRQEFCDSMFLSAKALEEASQLREQLTAIVRTTRPGAIGKYEARLPQPTDAQLQMLKQITVAGFIDHVAIRADLAPSPPEIARRPRRAIDVPYLTLFPSHAGGHPSDDAGQFVYIHPSSVLAHSTTSPANNMPKYLIYSNLQRSSPSLIDDAKAPRTRMHPLTAPTDAQLTALAASTPLLEYGKPIGKVQALERGPDGAERRQCWVGTSLVGERGGMGWPLLAREVVQRRDGAGGRGWVVEMVVR